MPIYLTSGMKKKGELAEDWLYEAITETYIPIIIVINSLLRKGVDFHFTISISPTLISMLSDPLLQNRYQKHLEKLIELSEKELFRTKDSPEFHKLAGMYNYLFKEAYYYYHDKYKNQLLTAYKEFQDMGKIELITSCATHGYLPLMLTDEAVNAQINLGVSTYQEFFGKRPASIWLPECGFSPAIDPYLAENNIRYFVSSSHGVLYAKPRPRYGFYAPIYTPHGVAAFGRDMESSKQVWSSNEGYPGDYNYREFYRDIGWDLDYDYVKTISRLVSENILDSNTTKLREKQTGRSPITLKLPGKRQQNMQEILCLTDSSRSNIYPR